MVVGDMGDVMMMVGKINLVLKKKQFSTAHFFFRSRTFSQAGALCTLSRDCDALVVA